MAPFIYQDVINLIASFPIRRSPSMFMNVAMLERFSLENWMFSCRKFFYPNLTVTINLT